MHRINDEPTTIELTEGQRVFWLSSFSGYSDYGHVDSTVGNTVVIRTDITTVFIPRENVYTRNWDGTPVTQL